MRRLGMPARVVDHAEQSLSPEAREARDLIAYLHRTRDEMEEVTREGRKELAQLEAARRELQTEWIERQKKRIAELEQGFHAAEKRLESEVARLTTDIQDRSLRAQLEKQSGRRIAKLGSDARAEVDAAVVDALASSQQDLGVGAEVAATGVPPEQLVAGMRIRVRGFKQAVVFRRHDGRVAATIRKENLQGHGLVEAEVLRGDHGRHAPDPEDTPDPILAVEELAFGRKAVHRRPGGRVHGAD